MSIIKRLKWKDKSGKTTDYDLGTKASNVEQDATHRFVSDTEKQTWNGKADPGDIPSGAAADYGVANNDTTNRADMLSTAQVAYQHGKEIDQLNSELSSLKASFQDGIKKIAGKLTSLGVPTSNTASPDTISNNIQTLYNNRYNEGISAAAIQTRDVVASTDNFGNYNDYNLTRSLKFNPPSLSGYRIVGAYIKKIYISNSNKAFGSGTFEIQKNGNSYYILSKDCNWSSGGTAVNATMTFIYQK